MPKPTITLLFVISLLLSSNAVADEKPNLALNPATSWSYTYLMNSVLTLEYLSVLQQPGLKEKERMTFFTSDDGVAIWKRGTFGFFSAKKRSQRIPHLEKTKGFLSQQKSEMSKNEKLLPIANKFYSLSSYERLKQARKDIETTFSKEVFGTHWHTLSSAYNATIPSCPISFSDVRTFTDHQQKLFSNGQTANANDLVKPIIKWNLEKIQCLIFTMIASTERAKKNKGFEPIHLLRAMQQTSSPLAKNPAIKTMLAIRLLQLTQYAETLRVLVELQDIDKSMRLPYEIVQRVYSIKQKGQGAVALRGL